MTADRSPSARASNPPVPTPLGAVAGAEPRPAAPAGRPLPLPLPWLLGLLALALALRLPNYGQSIWFDEACMSTQRLGSWPQLLATLYVDIHPPLYVGFMYVWNSVFGDAEISMRLPSLLCGLASIPLTYSVGSRLVGRSAAIWAAVLVTLSPVHVWYSIEARLYAPMLFLVLLATHLFLRLFDGASARTWFLYGAVVLAMLATHYYLAPYVLLLACLAPIVGRRRGMPAVGRRLFIVNGSALVILALWVVFKLSFAEFETSQGYLVPFTLGEAYGLLFQWFWTGNCITAAGSSWQIRHAVWIAFQTVGVGLVAAGLFRLLRARRELPDAFVALLLLLTMPVFLLALPWIGYPSTYIERSALPALPFFFMIAGLGLSSLSPKWLRVTAAAVVVAMCAVDLSAYFAFGDRFTVYKPHPDWRSAARYLGDEIDDGAAGRPVFTSMPNPRSLSYYDVRIQFEPNLQPTPDKAASTERALTRVLGDGFGGTLAGFARRATEELERKKTELREGARLMVYPTVDGSLAALRLGERRRDGVFYLVKNHLHPPGDETIDALVRDPHLRVLDTRTFPNVTVYKMQEIE